MYTKNNFNQLPDSFYNVTSGYLKYLKDHYATSGYKTLLVERNASNNVSVDTLVVNFHDNAVPLAISFTFIPMSTSKSGIDTVFLQIYSVLPSKPNIKTLNQLEKSLNFINNQLPIGHLGISNANEVTLKSIQALSTNNYNIDTNVFNKITDLFQMIISVFNPKIDDVCSGKKTFKQLAYELSN